MPNSNAASRRAHAAGAQPVQVGPWPKERSREAHTERLTAAPSLRELPWDLLHRNRHDVLNLKAPFVNPNRSTL